MKTSFKVIITFIIFLTSIYIILFPGNALHYEIEVLGTGEASVYEGDLELKLFLKVIDVSGHDEIKARYLLINHGEENLTYNMGWDAFYEKVYKNNILIMTLRPEIVLDVLVIHTIEPGGNKTNWYSQSYRLKETGRYYVSGVWEYITNLESAWGGKEPLKMARIETSKIPIRVKYGLRVPFRPG